MVLSMWWVYIFYNKNAGFDEPTEEFVEPAGDVEPTGDEPTGFADFEEKEPTGFSGGRRTRKKRTKTRRHR